ncbi:MAG: anti-sigma factor [Pseudomonadota bacterium]
MNYSDPQLIDRLAAEYVLGTLQGLPRRRFERLMRADLTVRQSTYAWERRINSLAARVEPVTPPASVWRDIEQALDSEHNPRAVTRTRVPSTINRWLVAAVAVLAVALSVLYFDTPVDDAPPAYTSILQDDDKQPAWIVDSYQQARRVQLRALNAPPPPTDRDYQLWIVPADGSVPVSLGILNRDINAQLTLNDAQYRALATGAALAISIEPVGGSPTGAPTGPIPYSGALSGA